MTRADRDASRAPALVENTVAAARCAEAQLTSTPLTSLTAVVQPLWHRIRLGEGGLIGMATWAAAWESRRVVPTVTVFVLSTALLMGLYLFNDVADREIDAYNPKKIARHRAPLLEHPSFYFWLALAIQISVCVAAWALLGAWPAACATSLLVLNPFYSAVAKRVPGLDVAVVGAMGGAVIGLASTTPILLAIATAMTAISHAFQTRVDETPDRATGVHSSASTSPALRYWIWLALTLMLAAALWRALGPLWALSSAVPHLLLTRSQHANRGWAGARLYFAVIWIAAMLAPRP